MVYFILGICGFSVCIISIYLGVNSMDNSKDNYSIQEIFNLRREVNENFNMLNDYFGIYYDKDGNIVKRKCKK